jgi:hypothetical protein
MHTLATTTTITKTLESNAKIQPALPAIPGIFTVISHERTGRLPTPPYPTMRERRWPTV